MTDAVNTLKSVNSSSDIDHLNRLAGIVILAGGASKRMGSPKAELMLPTNERLLDYHVRQALKLSAATAHNVSIMIADNGRGFGINPDLILNNPQVLIIHITDYLSVDDFASNDNEQIETGGALVAIEAALQYLTSSMIMQSTNAANSYASWLMVISCDSLIAANDLWKKLQPYITQAVDKSVICLTDEHHLYPLLGIYRLSIDPDLKHYIDNGQRQVMKFIQPIVQPVTFLEDWQSITNFNTPKDFERACIALRNI
ncbi:MULTISPECIES: molybdenum cofactor guanylyltransferase [unclassified Psychrobacter]|uniref:molybdenum cofactor guanylyltransferase n=1 Tax=unclassified Psychrobacter TaxID=196806 RepID=UPI001919FDCA|nr:MULTISPECIES: NTP transferase domain-containing protein [unclassified Psychrobacter]